MALTDTPLPHIRTLWRPEQFTRVSNPGFEANTTGYAVTAGINAAGTSITRITTDHYAGSACGQLVTTATNGSGLNFDLGSDTYFEADQYGTAYVAIVYLKRVSGAKKAKLIFGSLGTPGDRAELDLDLLDHWTPFRVLWLPTANRTDVELAIMNGYAAALTLKIDQLAIYQVDAFSQVENSNFRNNTTGWDIGASNIAVAATSLTRKTTDGMDPANQFCAELVTTATSGSGADYPLGNRKFTQGRTYTLRVALKSVSGSTSCRLRFGSIGTSADRGDTTVTLTTSWAIYEVDWTPSADRTDACVAIGNGGAAIVTARLGLVEAYEALDDISSPTPGGVYAMSADWLRGQPTQEPRAPAGTITVMASDAGKTLFPLNSSSALYGAVKPGRRIWGRATYAGSIYALFYGTLSRIVSDGDALTTTLMANDSLADIAQHDFEWGFAQDSAYWLQRNLVFGLAGQTANVWLPDTRLNLPAGAIESSMHFYGNESTSALTYLEQLNEATGSLHYIDPSAQAEVLWRYTTVDRTVLTDVTRSDETVNDDFAALSGAETTDAALENHQFVPWQSYDVQPAPETIDGIGFGYVMLAQDRSAYLADADDPYLHYLDDRFGSNDNVPEPTFERLARIDKKGRKRVRLRRVYPNAFVPFSMAAGDVLSFTIDFSIPISGLTLSLGGPTGATNVETSIAGTGRHFVITLFAAAADTVDFFGLAGTPWEPRDEQTAELVDYASIVDVGDRGGPSIQTPYIPSAGMAEGLGRYRNWRYGTARLHPTLRVENRFPTSMQRDVGDHVTLNAARWQISGVVFVILGLHGTFDTGSRSWAYEYQLEDVPAGATWFTLDDANKGLDDAVVLAY